MRNETLEIKQRELVLLKQKEKVYEELPHLYGFPLYKWAKEFMESDNHECYLLAGNQLSKSSTQIRKCIHWSTETELWEKLWPDSVSTPNLMWYLYPNKDVATEEFILKWKEFMPRGSMKEDPKYGWKAYYKDRKIYKIEWNSGMTLIFKSYAQSTQDLQTGTAYAIFCFTKGHRVLTEDGLKPVEQITTRDRILTRDGYKNVKGVSSREAEVYKFHFDNGEILEGTREHPILTDRGWKELGQLTKLDRCYSFPGWKLLKKLYCLREKFTRDTPEAKTIERKITLSVVKVEGILCTLRSGKHTMKKVFQKAMLYTIKTLIHWITESKISNVCLGRNTQEFIKLKNGKRLRPTHLLAHSVGRTLYLAHHKNQNLDTVLKSVGKRRIENVKRVFNLTVEDCPEYFCNGILTHNCDEELPINVLPELSARLNATDGYFSMVFTATIGQDYWRRVMEGKSEEEEKVHADKWQVSMYDCMYYADGSASPWTEDKILRAIQKCASQTEILRRIYGRFVVAGGLKYEAFNRDKNTYPNHVKIPHDWKIYSGVDIGSGGEKGHPAAYVFVAVSPDMRQGRVFKGKRLDNLLTTSQDILQHYIRDRGKLPVIIQSYDYASKDFWTFASRKGEPFTPAQKGTDAGVQMINTLFKGGMLKIRKDDVELEKLMNEISTLQTETNKRQAVDDFVDAMRYALMPIPWDWAALDDQEWDEDKFAEKEEVVHITEAEERRNFALGKDIEEPDEFEQEFMEWNEMMGELD